MQSSFLFELQHIKKGTKKNELGNAQAFLALLRFL
jgi:hypothetical protein